MSDIQEGRLYAAAKYTSRSDWKKVKKDGKESQWGGESFAKVVGEVNVDPDGVHDWGGVLYAAMEHTADLEPRNDEQTVLYEGPVRQGKRRRFVRAPAFVTKIQGRGKLVKIHIDGVGNPYEVRHPNDGHDPFSKTDGADLILQERAYQVRRRDFDPDHDMQHDPCALVDAAVSVLSVVRGDPQVMGVPDAGQYRLETADDRRDPWPFGADYSNHPLYEEGEEIEAASKSGTEKISGVSKKVLEKPGQQVHALAIAGALIAAEIDRIIEEEYRKGNPLKPSQIYLERDRKHTFMGVEDEDDLTVKSAGMNAMKRELPF